MRNNHCWPSGDHRDTAISEREVAGRRTLAEWMRSRLSDAQRFLALCVLVGFLCGLSAVAFHFSIHHIFDWLWDLAAKQDPI